MSAGEAPSCSRFPPAERPAPLLAGPDGRSDGALPHRRSSLVHGTADMAWGAAISALAVTLTIEHLPEPLGLNTLAPRFSWHPAATQLPHSQRGLQQIAYRLQVAESAAALEAGPWLWDTGSVASNRSVLVDETQGLESRRCTQPWAALLRACQAHLQQPRWRRGRWHT